MPPVNRLQIVFLCLLSGVLMGSAWPGTGDFPAILFVALVPLLILDEFFHHNQDKYSVRSTYKYFAIAYIVFNLIGTWWLICVQENTTTRLVSMLGTAFANGILQTFPFWFFHFARRKLNRFQGYSAFLLFLLGFEYFHFDWELAWPWLTFGNAFANWPSWIQWYEYTGVLGGSLWVLVTNLIVFLALRKANYMFKELVKTKTQVVLLALWIGLPLLVSQVTYHTYEEPRGMETEVAICQPNIDPYNEKFSRNAVEQIQEMAKMVEAKLTYKTQFALFPETAIQENTVLNFPKYKIGLSGILESKMEDSRSYRFLDAVCHRFPNLTVVAGLTSQKNFYEGEEIPITARTDEWVDFYYDVYNSAVSWNVRDSVEFYNKSKLVIGVERLPFSSALKPIEELALDLGGASGSLGTQEEAEVFSNSLNQVVAAPLICFESVFGEYVADFVLKGANVLFLITNDGWWDTSPGYRQHLAFSRLRCIETRRNMARCANTGTSCFVNQRGDIIQPTQFWVKDVLLGNINTNNELTFYVRHGDYIGRISLFVAVLLLLYAYVVHVKQKVDRKKRL